MWFCDLRLFVPPLSNHLHRNRRVSFTKSETLGGLINEIGESAAGAYPEIAVKTMAKICIEAESSLDYNTFFKEMIRATPLPMSTLESLASSDVQTANKAKAKLIIVLTRGGTTAKLVAKYRPAVPILSVVVPVFTSDTFNWSCSDESPARHSLIYRGLIPVLAEGSAKASDSEST